MTRTMKVQLGRGGIKNYFEYSYDTDNPASVTEAVQAYRAFYDNYRKTHTISSRTWNFPILYIDNVPKYVVTPNGRWDEYKER